MSRLLISLFFIICFFSNTHAQIVINGFVKDSISKLIVSASVILQSKQHNLIVAYAITNSKGDFEKVNNNIKNSKRI